MKNSKFAKFSDRQEKSRNFLSRVGKIAKLVDENGKTQNFLC